MKRIHWILIAIVAVIIIGALILYLWPENLPQDQYQKISSEIGPYNAVIIFNPGGWGNATLAESKDFTPILEQVQQTFDDMGFNTVIIPYARTPAGLSARLTDVKELLNYFKNTSKIQSRTVTALAQNFPDKQFIVIGFSNGGGLTYKTCTGISAQPNVCGMVVGVPNWYRVKASENFLVLNNSGRDTLSKINIKDFLWTIVKAPFIWLKGKITGHGESLALSFQFPGHVYDWSSPEVGHPIIMFLEDHYKGKNPAP